MILNNLITKVYLIFVQSLTWNYMLIFNVLEYYQVAVQVFVDQICVIRFGMERMTFGVAKLVKKKLLFSKILFFSHSHLDPREIFEFTYWWSRKFTKYDDLRWEMKRAASKLSDHTINDWLQFCRDICVEFFIRNPKVIGGPGKIVEIDETLISRRKYERGRVVNQVWLFGGVERGSSENCFMEIVEARNADTLLPIIQRRIAPGTTIVSDLWRAYFRIDQLPEGYEHLRVNHSLNFVNPEDPRANTQTIETSWQKLKIPLKSKYGTSRDAYADYITEHCWKKEFGQNNEAFYHFWLHLLQHYSPYWT
jgi:hypothetical protein